MRILVTIMLCLALFFSKAQFDLVPKYHVTFDPNQSKGYYFLCPIRTDARAAKFRASHLVLNAKGELVYFKQFDESLSPGNFQLQKNGQFTYYHSGKLSHVLMTEQCHISDSLTSANSLMPDGHAFEILPNGNYLLMAIETVTMDLSMYRVFGKNNIAGSKKAQVKFGVIQELDANKKLVFEWRSSKYFNVMDIDYTYLNDTLNVDFTHFNAVCKDLDGNYLVSSRNLHEITKVDKNTEKILWRLGGKKNQIKFVNDSLRFVAQHDIRVTGPNEYSLFDNGKGGDTIHPASAKVYQLNEKNKTVNLVWQYVDQVNSHSNKGLGNVQQLENGKFLINYGTCAASPVVFNVVDKQKKKIFELQFDDTLRSYRTYNYLHLPKQFKQPAVRVKNAQGKCVLSADGGYAAYRWSDGSQGQEITVQQNGIYQVMVPCGEGAFIASEVVVVDFLK